MRKSFRRIGMLGLAIVSLSATAAAAPLDQPALEAALAAVLEGHPTARRTTVCLKVIDVADGETLFDRGGDRLLTPASNLKIYTTACALDLFGPEHRFKTTLRATGPIEDGVLQGNIELVGGGDSMFTSGDLAKMVDHAATAWGMRRVAGAVRIDNSRYKGPIMGPGWMWDDDPEPYNMPVTPLMVDFNVLKVRLSPAPDGVKAELLPPSDYPPIRPSDAAPDKKRPRVVRTPLSEVVEVIAGPPLDKPIIGELTPHDPARWVSGVLTQMLIDRGVEVANKHLPAAQGGVTPQPFRQIIHQGPTLLTTLTHFNKVSENAVGEVLLHEIAVKRKVVPPGWPDGAKAITRWLRDEAKLERNSFRLVDGSGLSRYDMISADSAVRLLAFMQRHKYGAQFFDALPPVGRDAKDPDETADAARPLLIRAKGGSMTGVSTISGYVQTEGGRLLAFSLLANGFIGDNKPVFDLRSKIFPLLASYRPAEPPASADDR